jgi:aspartyl-tRNA(Asn)/glutamyl-tRNA(Gln) amidotransferase subunit C
MKVAAQDVVHVADLANLELTESERTRMLRDLNHILEYIDRLNQLDTSTVMPLAQFEVAGAGHAAGSQFDHAMRSDERRPSLSHEAALQNAPQSDGTFFEVPKVIDR